MRFGDFALSIFVVFAAGLGILFVSGVSNPQDGSDDQTLQTVDTSHKQTLNNAALDDAVRLVASRGGTNAPETYWDCEAVPEPVSKEEFIQATIKAYPGELNESSKEFLRNYLTNYDTSRNDTVSKALRSREELESLIGQQRDLQFISSSLASGYACPENDPEKAYGLVYRDFCKHLAKNLAGSFGSINCSIEQIQIPAKSCFRGNYTASNLTEGVYSDSKAIEIRLESLDEPRLTWIFKVHFIMDYPEMDCGLGTVD